MKQSPRCWNDVIDTFLIGEGFKPLVSDSALYVRGQGDGKIIVSLYVDDILLFSSRLANVNSVKKALNSEFKMTDSGEVDTILGIQIRRNRKAGTLTMSQELYANQILQRFSLEQCTGRSTPLEPGLQLSKDMAPLTEAEKQLMERTPYREAIGSLMYLMLSTRPDLAAAVQYLSRFANNPSPIHWAAVKRVFAYVQLTKSLKLSFVKQGYVGLKCYSDSDWQACLDTRRSTSGYIVKLGGAAISWSSKRQKSVSLSTCEAEYVAACEATREVIWERSVLSELGYPQKSPVPIFMDSQSAIQLIKNPVFHDKSKHIQGKMHYVRERAGEGVVTFHKVDTKLNVADSLTKGVPAPKTIFCRTSMGLHSSLPL